MSFSLSRQVERQRSEEKYYNLSLRGSWGRIELSSQASQALMPEVGDLFVATVTRVEDYGAYVKLDEFSGIEGLVHISEISTTWVRNIREHARQGQKLVLRVLRVSSQRNQIDLSLRRVTGREKDRKSTRLNSSHR